jgi:hypothetical protein
MRSGAATIRRQLTKPIAPTIHYRTLPPFHAPLSPAVRIISGNVALSVGPGIGQDQCSCRERPAELQLHRSEREFRWIHSARHPKAESGQSRGRVGVEWGKLPVCDLSPFPRQAAASRQFYGEVTAAAPSCGTVFADMGRGTSRWFTPERTWKSTSAGFKESAGSIAPKWTVN